MAWSCIVSSSTCFAKLVLSSYNFSIFMFWYSRRDSYPWRSLDRRPVRACICSDVTYSCDFAWGAPRWEDASGIKLVPIAGF